MNVKGFNRYGENAAAADRESLQIFSGRKETASSKDAEFRILVELCLKHSKMNIAKRENAKIIKKPLTYPFEGSIIQTTEAKASRSDLHALPLFLYLYQGKGVFPDKGVRGAPFIFRCGFASFGKRTEAVRYDLG